MMPTKARQAPPENLVERLQAGDFAAYEELVNQFQAKVYALAIKLTKNPAEAEEVVQDVFVSVFKKINEFRGDSALATWIYRITVNTALMKLRSKKQADKKRDFLEQDLDELPQDKVPGNDWSKRADEQVLQKELREALQAAIDELPAPLQLIVLLKDVEGLRNEEIASVMNLSIPAVKSRLHRARLYLRDRLARYIVKEEHL